MKYRLHYISNDRKYAVIDYTDIFGEYAIEENIGGGAYRTIFTSASLPECLKKAWGLGGKNI